MRPCKKCGADYRYKNGNCIACSRQNAFEKYHTHPEISRAYSVAYRKSHQEQCKASVDAWTIKNPDRVIARNKAWAKRNPEKVRAGIVAWEKANPEKVKAKSATWRKAHPDIMNAQKARRRATKINATPLWANDFFIKEIYHLAKIRTKVTGFQWHVDHIVPLQSKLVCGLHCEANLQILEASHNCIKGNRTWPDMP